MKIRPYSDLNRKRYREETPGIVVRLRDFLAGYDWLQILALTLLLSLGLIFIYSTGIQVGTSAALGFFDKQLQWLLLGVILWFLFSLVNCKSIGFRVFSVLFYLVSIILLIVVLKYGLKINGAKSWLVIPGLGFRLQPAEPAKIGTILLLAAIFSSPLFRVNNLWCLLLAGVITLLPMLLISLQPDFGSGMVFLPILAGVVFAAGIRWRYIIISGILLLLLAGGAIANEYWKFKPLLKPYQIARIEIFLNPEKDPHNRGYNQLQARLAVGSGGLYGKGVGKGTQNTLGFLPQTVSNNDFIFSVIAEETGYLGCLLLISSYLLLFVSVFRTAWISDPLGRYIAIGISCMLFTHCFVNIGMSIGLSPITGIPLPFVSYGGSFLLAGFCAFGILQAIYRRNYQKE